MAYLSCPQCGSAAHVRLAPPFQVRCRACAYAGAPAEEDAAVLASSSAALGHLEGALSHLTDARRSFVLRGQAALALVTGIVLQTLCWAAIGGGHAVGAWVRHGLSVETALAGGAVLVPSVLATLAVAIPFRRRVRAMDAACSAEPPRLRGGPPGCRMCGAGLETTDLGRKLVSCRHCGAHNLITPDLVARAGAARISSAREVVAQAADAARALERGSTLAIAVLVFITLAGMTGCLAAWYATADTLPRKFVVVSLRRASCIALWQPTFFSNDDAEVTLITADGTERRRVSDGSTILDARSYLEARDLRGLAVETSERPPRSGQVVGGRGTRLVVLIGGQQITVPANAVCLVDRYALPTVNEGKVVERAGD